MATRIAISTVYPDRMGELAGKPTRFPEKLIAGLDIDQWIKDGYRWKMRDAGYNIQISNITNVKHPKTTTIRSNYEYWKSKEGQLLQPFFWAGKPYRSKHVVFCPEVRLKRVIKVEIRHYVPNENAKTAKWVMYDIHKYGTLKVWSKFLDRKEIKQFTQNEGFDHPDHFWMWFDKDFYGALLELESAEG